MNKNFILTSSIVITALGFFSSAKEAPSSSPEASVAAFKELQASKAQTQQDGITRVLIRDDFGNPVVTIKNGSVKKSNFGSNPAHIAPSSSPEASVATLKELQTSKAQAQQDGATLVLRHDDFGNPAIKKINFELNPARIARIRLLNILMSILERVKDKASADAAVVPAIRVINAHNTAALRWGTKPRKEFIDYPIMRCKHNKYDVKEMIEKLNKANQCYGSSALMDALRSIKY